MTAFAALATTSRGINRSAANSRKSFPYPFRETRLSVPFWEDPGGRNTDTALLMLRHSIEPGLRPNSGSFWKLPMKSA